MPHFRWMRRKAVSFRSIGWNGSDNLCAEKRRYRGSRFRARRWNDDLHPRETDSRWRRVSAEKLTLCGASPRRVGRAGRDGRDTVQAHWIGSLRQLRPSRLVSGSASWRPRYYVGETAKISNVPFLSFSSRSSMNPHRRCPIVDNDDFNPWRFCDVAVAIPFPILVSLSKRVIILYIFI